jgi:nicotinate-nucleotide--dimethylbenzimidazole phosphoribosyltransferase
LAAEPRAAALRPLDASAATAAAARQRALLKPPGSLGRLEELAVWMAGVSGDAVPRPRPRVVVAAADHGVAAEGVSAYPQAVTGRMLGAFVGGGAAIAVLARAARADVVVVDAGVAAVPTAARGRVRATGLRPSRNLAREPALSPRALAAAVAAGRDLAAEAAARGANVLVGGEMGIANTTPATCLAAWLTGRPPAALCGRGTGIDDAALGRKVAVVERALALHGPAIDGPREALRRLGGGEIAVLCGLALGAGEHGLGYVCDGLIATAAAGIAVALAPALAARMLAGHRSPEPAHGALLDALDLEPLLDLRMRLGEGSGAALALGLLDAACALHRDMATFADAGIAGPS